MIIDIRYRVLIRMVSIVMLVFATVASIPALVLSYVDHQTVYPFALMLCAGVVVGILGCLTGKREYEPVGFQESILLVVFSWVGMGLLAAIPFWYGGIFVHPVDAIFEAVSGITTTGAEMITQWSLLTRAMTLYHQWLEFVGGVGIVVLTIAVVPQMQGVYGINQTDLPGAMDHMRMTPRMRQTALIVWVGYFSLAVLCACLYRVFGMSWFDAMGQSMTTVSTGGFMLHGHGFEMYTPEVHWVAIIFMLIGSVNFSLIAYRKLWHGDVMNWKEIRVFFLWIIMFVVLVFLLNWHAHYAFEIDELFNCVSMLTTTGYTSGDLSILPVGVPVLLVLSGLIGGCGGSTTGGVKWWRLLRIWSDIRLSFRLIQHPRLAYDCDGEQSRRRLLIWSFLSVFLMVYLMMAIILALMGYPFDLAFKAATAILSNTGASIDQLAVHYGIFHGWSKLFLIIGMLMGRLEIIIVILMCVPGFWSKHG